MNSNLGRTIGGIVLAVFLSVVIFFEFKIGFSMVQDRQMGEITAFIEHAESFGKASVSIDEIASYEEIPTVNEEGTVLELSGYNVKVRLNGKLTENYDEEEGSYSYTSSDKNTIENFSYMKYESKVTDCRNAVKSFWYGDTSEIANFAFHENVPEDVQYMQCTYKGGNVPVMYSESEGLYNMLITGEGEYYLVLTAPDPYVLTDENKTIAYGDPYANPQTSHTYSKYEENATANTLKALKEKEEEEKEQKDNPYKTSEVTGTSATYTAKSDDNIREQMSTVGKFTWQKDGTCKDTEMYIDIKSEEAQKSKWTLTATTYSYECSGLKIYALSGTRSAEAFSVEGTIQNSIDAERPYVVLVKYLDTNDELLGVSVVDKRNNPLKPEGVDKFSVTVTPVKDKVDIQRIAAIMFEMY